MQLVSMQAEPVTLTDVFLALTPVGHGAARGS
jgi:hypothetical protein